jgi:hypothetical protein
MNILTSSPFNYSFNDLVLVRVSATNSYGNGSYGYNTGTATIRSVPQQMPNITIASYSDTQITVSWPSITGIAAGNSNILSYNLFWNAGNSSSASTFVTDSLVNNWTFSGLTGGNNYTFTVRARNIYGYGNLSSPVSVITIDVPSQIQIPTVA